MMLRLEQAIFFLTILSKSLNYITTFLIILGPLSLIKQLAATKYINFLL